MLPGGFAHPSAIDRYVFLFFVPGEPYRSASLTATRAKP